MCASALPDCEERHGSSAPHRPQSLPRLQLVRTQSLRLQLTPVQPTPLYSSAHFNTSTKGAALHVSRERHLVTRDIIMVISEKSSYLDPLVMNSSTTTGGRWCSPASNAESFMSSSPSYCVAASPGEWGAQGELASLSLIANALS